MNLFYENYPTFLIVKGDVIPILTDFRDHIQLIDMLNDDSLKLLEKMYFLEKYFLKKPVNLEAAIEELMRFILMTSQDLPEKKNSDFVENSKKEVYSFEYDYPFIFSAFLSEYGINLKTVSYLHWWEFRNLFEGLSEDTEIKKRIMYRSIDLNEIKDKDEKKRIQKIQWSIALPNSKPTDYDIGNAFGW